MISCQTGRLRGPSDGHHNLPKDDFANPMTGNECKTKIVDELLAELSHHDACTIDISADVGSPDMWLLES